MKTLLSIAFVFITTICWSQNVGVNQPSPNYPLDVNGTTNIDGNLRINGVAGTSGQVLRTNGSGNTYWAGIGQYDNARTYLTDGIFIVPAGVTKVKIEAWGGGGGGSKGGGGGGGSYLMTLIDVFAADELNINLGAGGAASSSNTTVGGDGGFTEVLRYGFTILTAIGGNGAGLYNPGANFNFLFTDNVKYEIGSAGEPNTTTYSQRSSTDFLEIIKYGSGGGVWPDYSRQSKGCQTVYNYPDGTLALRNNAAFGTYPPGTGGGGGDSFYSRRGWNGKVVISWE